MINARLKDLRKKLKAEVGDVLTPGVNDDLDLTYNALLENKQAFFYEQYDWPHLKIQQDITVPAGTRLITFPANISNIKPWEAHVYFTSCWHPVAFGVTDDLFNASDSDLGETSDPIRRVALYNTASSTISQLEVWPIPGQEQKLRIRGFKALPKLQADDDIAVLDDLMIVLFVAAEILTKRKQPDAQAKLQQATSHFARLKGASPKNPMFIMGGTRQRRLSTHLESYYPTTDR